jgi:hypothetical protein
MEVVKGKITTFNEDGTVVIQATVPNIERAILRKYNDVEIGFSDGRHISAIQRRKVYAILNEIAAYAGDDTESTKTTMKFDFLMNRFQGIQRKMFSLSSVDMNTASCFIDYLIEFCVKNDIPMRISPLEYCENVGKYIYACLMNKRCCICGRKGQLHHVQSVGSQGYRDKIDHIGLDCLPLCAEHHIESHTIGQKDFMAKWHLQPVKIDDKICKLYHLNKKEKSA